MRLLWAWLGSLQRRWLRAEEKAAAALLVEVPIGLRLPVLATMLAATFMLGIAATSWRPDWEAERLAALEQEVLVIRNQQRHIWKSHEGMRTRRDRIEAFGSMDLRPPKMLVAPSE